MEDFEITMLPMGRNDSVKFKVEVYYDTDVVKRFRLIGGAKVMELEKRLLSKRSSWKVVSINFAFENINETTTRNLLEIFHLIDEHLTGKPRITYRHPLERKSEW